MSTKNLEGMITELAGILSQDTEYAAQYVNMPNDKVLQAEAIATRHMIGPRILLYWLDELALAPPIVHLLAGMADYGIADGRLNDAAIVLSGKEIT